MDTAEIFKKISALKQNLSKVLKGKDDIIEFAITALLTGGHLLIEDVPGVGKTTLAHALAQSIECTFKRIQFTSDLLPSDVIGVTIFNEATRDFEFKHGPIFANVVLADEINRATPKTQSAMLEAMNEGQVTVDNMTYQIAKPFFIVATQNPYEHSGTYPLPESQLDRFALSIKIGYPDEASEREIARSTKLKLSPTALSPVLSSDEALSMQKCAEAVKVEEDLLNYIVTISTATRQHPSVRLGVSPRGTRDFYRSAQAMALVSGRDYIIPDDVKKLAVPALAHRILPVRYGIEEGSMTPENIVLEILSKTAVPM